MKLLFVHDHKFRSLEGKMYSTGGLSDMALVRYTNIFEKTTVIARVIAENTAKDKFSEITNKDVIIKNGLEIGNKGFRLEVEKADCIISRMPSFYGLKVIKLAQKMNKPYLVEMVGCPWDALWNHSLKGKIVAPYMTLATKAKTKNAPYVLYVTNEFLQKRYPTNGKTVCCSNVALTEFDDTVLKKRFEKFKQDSDKIIIGTTAAVDVKYKGQQYVIEALGQLKKKGITNYEYQLVGGGEQRYLKSVAERYGVYDQVKILGSMPHDKVIDWLDTIDIYAQPSRQEGLPRALIEAMSRALPAIGAKTAGIPELLEREYIFSNTKNNINEICEILMEFHIGKMKEQAQRNYNESKKYDKNILEARRQAFFKNFIESIKK
jgi:glycosyltransferase involved in cell wall biosynthesis